MDDLTRAWGKFGLIDVEKTVVYEEQVDLDNNEPLKFFML